MLVPFVWMVLTSLKDKPEVLRIPMTWLPDNMLNLKNYIKIFNEFDFKRYFLNTFIVSAGNTIFTVVFSAIAGYSFSKFKFPGKEVIFFGLVILVLTTPQEALVVPQYIIASKLKLVNTYPGLMMPGLISAFGVFLMRQFSEGIPDEYIEAARIDGFSEIGIYVRIILPLTKPAIATLSILKFIGTWNDFMWPLLIATTEKMKTVPVGMQIFTGEWGIDYGAIAAAAFMSVLPMLVVFILMQKYVIKGITMTGIK
ncbi:MAG: carbohydrate ABC transporter permease [Actinobacteria bacterium]|nr:carbohydrate ABC transporter permease [Actinomycetota bacterium]